MTLNKLIYGKDDTSGIVSIDIKGDKTVIHMEGPDGNTTRELKHKYWYLRSVHSRDSTSRLAGGLHYKDICLFDDKASYKDALGGCYGRQEDIYNISNDEERFMVLSGCTSFKHRKVEDISVLSFDIETTGIVHNENSKVLMITNTYKKGDKIVRKLFSEDEYNSDREMINEWTKWVRSMDPSIITGHNIFGFDLPYLKYRSGTSGLKLGRDGSTARFAKKASKFRKDGSQSYDYNNISVFGRQIIDTMFLSIKFDVGRQYSSYALKTIIQESGLQRDNRQFYEAKNIGYAWSIPEEREKIKRYGEHDADDSLALYEMMIPSFFYLAQSIPMGLQHIINRASGSQINSFMVRAYIQERHSIPKASPTVRYEGGISFGNPGIYDNVYKVDVASLYPSIMLQYKVEDKLKDPKGYFLQMLEFFTKERLANKKLSAASGDAYYKGLEQSQKIMINSAYGFLGAQGLHFNGPSDAARVTEIGRNILTKGIQYAEARGYQIVNADTDSFSFNNFNGRFEDFLSDLNDLYADRIIWENDGFYDKVLIVKAKNYALKQGDITTIKGSALKATMKEPALKLLNVEIIETLLSGGGNMADIYNCYAREIGKIDNIERWASKKTITDKVLKPKRTNEQRILDAIGNRPVQEGDKIHVFFEQKDKLSLIEDFSGIYDKDKLYEKLFKTLKVFEPVLDIEQFPNYKLKKNVDKRPQ